MAALVSNMLTATAVTVATIRWSQLGSF